MVTRFESRAYCTVCVGCDGADKCARVRESDVEVAVPRGGVLRMPDAIDPGAQIVPPVVPIGIATTPVVGAINVGVRGMAAVVRGAGRGGAGARGGTASVSARGS